MIISIYSKVQFFRKVAKENQKGIPYFLYKLQDRGVFHRPE